LNRHRTLLVGIGGQGILTAGQVLGAAAHATGRPVVVGQLHGMSQRGGSLECTVLCGPGESTFIGDAEADLVLGFELCETVRALPRMSASTNVLVSVCTVAPLEAVLRGGAIPRIDEALAGLRETAARVAAAELGWLPVASGPVLEALLERTSVRFREQNRRALLLGRSATRTGEEVRS
jgi:indolepyruvate ferredoxin oxidoreductase beta subunit